MTAREDGKLKLSGQWIAAMVIVAVVLVDQILKIWVKTHFFYGEEYVITDWFRLYFIENNGMAFGFELGSKMILTWFRIIAVIFLIYCIHRLCKREDLNKGFLVCISLITAGAAGNVIDCICYGLIFDDPAYPLTATLFPDGGGYATLFNGRVVDMLYFPLVEWNWPDWIPSIGGGHFIFFQPIFNVADASLSVGVIVMILFYSKYLSGPSAEEKDSQEETETLPADEPTEEN